MLMDFDVVVNYKELTDYNVDESVSGTNEGVGRIYISNCTTIICCAGVNKSWVHSPKVTKVGKCGEVHACIKKAQKQLCFH